MKKKKWWKLTRSYVFLISESCIRCVSIFRWIRVPQVEVDVALYPAGVVVGVAWSGNVPCPRYRVLKNASLCINSHGISALRILNIKNIDCVEALEVEFHDRAPKFRNLAFILSVFLGRYRFSPRNPIKSIEIGILKTFTRGFRIHKSNHGFQFHLQEIRNPTNLRKIVSPRKPRRRNTQLSIESTLNAFGLKWIVMRLKVAGPWGTVALHPHETASGIKGDCLE